MGGRSAFHKLVVLLAIATLAVNVGADESESSTEGVSRPEWHSWKTRRRADGGRSGAEQRRPRHRAHKEPQGAVTDEEAVQEDEPGVETCEVARLKCAYRVGCGMALQVIY